MAPTTRRAADVLVDCLASQGADRLFCVPGESYLALLDALRDEERIDLVACRHEGGAGMMAVADAKLTRRAGVLAVSRGPGATNASIAVHLAEQDAVPLVVLIGQVARHERGRGAFQEVDYGQMFGGVAKGVWEVHAADRIPETVASAFHLAQSGTPGPVVVSFPEDVLTEGTTAAPLPSRPAGSLAPGPEDIARIADLLAGAKRPLVIAGSALDRDEGRAALSRLAAAHHLPVALTFKHQEIFDNGSPLYAGHLGFKIPASQVRLLSRADLILAIGTRLGDVPTQGYRLPRAPVPDQPLVHVWPDAAVLGRVFQTEIALPCDPARFCAALADVPSPVPAAREAWASELSGVVRKLAAYDPTPRTDGLDFGVVVAELARHAPRDAIVVTDSGNFSGWVHLAWPWDGTQRAVGAAGGAMGLGVPGAVAACLRHPKASVIAFVGDGGALMTGNELATAASRGLKPKIVISDNATYGTIRLHQERDYPDRVSGTNLVNPDFAVWASSFGALGLTVENADDVTDTVGRFLAHDGAAVLSVRASAEAISAYTTISGLHARMRDRSAT